uniref:Rab9 effector protein with kelch motifs n=1 Tax=Oreochromis niloticus TaxID=8128 RepID=A0A669D6V8_ORENI
MDVASYNHEWDMAEGEGLQARYEHCRFVTKSCLQSLLVFGGAQQNRNCNCIQNVQMADSNPHWNVVTNGTPPSPRTYHTTSACLGTGFLCFHLFVFSGGEIGSAPASYSKLHVFDTGLCQINYILIISYPETNVIHGTTVKGIKKNSFTMSITSVLKCIGTRLMSVHPTIRRYELKMPPVTEFQL